MRLYAVFILLRSQWNSNISDRHLHLRHFELPPLLICGCISEHYLRTNILCFTFLNRSIQRPICVFLISLCSSVVLLMLVRSNKNITINMDGLLFRATEKVRYLVWVTQLLRSSENKTENARDVRITNLFAIDSVRGY